MANSSSLSQEEEVGNTRTTEIWISPTKTNLRLLKFSKVGWRSLLVLLVSAAWPREIHRQFSKRWSRLLKATESLSRRWEITVSDVRRIASGSIWRSLISRTCKTSTSLSSRGLREIWGPTRKYRARCSPTWTSNKFTECAHEFS